MTSNHKDTSFCYRRIRSTAERFRTLQNVSKHFATHGYKKYLSNAVTDDAMADNNKSRTHAKPSDAPSAYDTWKPTLDTDIREFLAMTGIDMFYMPGRFVDSPERRTYCRQLYDQRRQQMTKAEKSLETRLANCLSIEYGRSPYHPTRLRDLKCDVARHGLYIHDFGPKALAHLNKILEHYGIEPFQTLGNTYKG